MADKTQKIAAIAEKNLRKDLNASSPLPYQIFLPESGGLPTQSLLVGMVQGKTQSRVNSAAGSLVGAKDVKPLCFIYFSLQQPRHFELQVYTYSPGLGGLGAFIHRLAYAVPLRKPVSEPLSVVETAKAGVLSGRKVGFSGGATLVAGLNSSPDLLKLAGKLVVESVTDQSTVRYINPFCRILPQPQGSLLVLHTLSRVLAFRETLLAAEVLQFASSIEAWL